MKRYISYLSKIEKHCEKFKKDIITTFFTDTKKNLLPISNYQAFCFTPRYQEYWESIRNVIQMCDMIGVKGLENDKSSLTERISFLCNPAVIQYKIDFEYHIDFIIDVFRGHMKEVIDKIQVLDEEETARLDEAFNCHLQGCNYSTIVMSVSAIEFRLLSLMQSMKSSAHLEKCTLGQLISEYLQNKDEYKNIIPKKHEPLLTLCNIYRIFSVHPKREKITKQISSSILNLAFAFLLDKSLKHEADIMNKPQ